MGRVQDQVALVTGGARGMGASHVKALVDEGALVVFTDILSSEGEALEKELHGKAIFMKHDVTKLEDWEAIVKATEETFGPITILVNNAGIAVTPTIDELSEAEYRKVIDINQVGVFLGMKTVIPSMRKAGHGSIINISSISGILGMGGAAYVASKFAVRGMTKAVALEVAADGIRVNSIHPGLIETPMIMQPGVEEVVQQMAETVPLKRIGKPQDVSHLVLFLGSNESSYFTGAEFVIDGGVIIQ
ncbi:glucose 1-dehydrogenase [Exiguobacterium profundum]|uniref:glucose 1-dehydrogenase n=1 Tax=Exiguobacterium TaxID=33986 RepID=UPI0012F0F578|nr:MULTISPECIES: glucose 1-dehydrogenase [Exiguobacterium]MBG0918865.1 glucose 1-dehydrogenase [Exiguobacterium sp. SRB7LM]MDT0193052.1 glucose 1-dehydrogenase [Exiguobacterium sp. BG5(2022)]MDX5982448.1 glucose 1-dehydrogenase [Exiguobacterium profundum]QUP87002.1 glucose 1-dehydrogenase [Exiguobacterium sp. PFWT01]VXB93228.1 3-alpha-(or 20-beta)-hydroxysteroid dehydrogenase [Exiguobacterium sp. 8H]